MKVIAHTKGGFLVEVSKDEMPLLSGHQGAYSSDYKIPSIGDEIRTTKFFSHIMSVIGSQSEIKKRSDELRSISDDLNKIVMPELFNRS